MLVGLLGVAGIASASAAQLVVGGGSLASAVGAHPCAGVATATAAGVSGSTATGVSIVVPAGCTGRTVAVTVLSGATPTAAGSADVVAGATRVTVPSYTPTAALTVQAVVDGWNLPVAWSYVPPVRFGTCEVRSTATGTVVAGRTCTVQDIRVDTPWGAVGSRITNFYVQVTSDKSSHSEYLWFDLNLADARGLPTTWAWATSGISGDQIRPPTGYSCASLPALTGSGNASWGGGSSVYYGSLYERRSGVGGLTCTG